jgi:hypothetical protein
MFVNLYGKLLRLLGSVIDSIGRLVRAVEQDRTRQAIGTGSIRIFHAPLDQVQRFAEQLATLLGDQS